MVCALYLVKHLGKNLSFYNFDPLTVLIGVGTMANKVLNNFLHGIPFCCPTRMDSMQSIPVFLPEMFGKLLLSIY